MYRLLIVDDEAIIADSLYDVFKGIEALNLDVYKAYSAEEALEWLNRTRIDIVLTDIRMPVMDGIQLLKEIRMRWSQCKVIFLTGHNEFDYIYTAIQNQGYSYVLKTDGYDKVIKTVSSAVGDIEKDFKLEALAQKANEQLSMTSALLHKEYLLNFLNGSQYASEIKQQDFQRLNIALRANMPVLPVLGRIDSSFKELTYFENIERIYAIKLLIERYSAGSVRSVSINDEFIYFIWLIQPNMEDEENEQAEADEALWNKTVLYISGSLEIIQNLCKSSLGISITFSVGSEPVGWESLPEKYAYLKMLINRRIGLGEEMVLQDHHSGYPKGFEESDYNTNHAYISNLKLKLLERRLEQNQPNEFNKLFQEMMQLQLETLNNNANANLEIYYSVSLLFLSYLNKWNISEKVSMKIHLDKLMKMEAHESIEAAFEYLRQLAAILFEVQNMENEKRTTDTISTIQQYISENLNGDLSLVKLGELVYFNPSYLSRLFKQVTGFNLSEYICDLKISRAKQILENSSIKINDIAEALGFNSSTNFIRFFKKITKSTPQEYRESATSGKEMNM